MNKKPISELGKIPPQALEFEEAIIGAMLVATDALSDSIEIIKPSYFYNPQNAIICECIFELYKENIPIDLLSVINKLKQKGKLDEVGGSYFIAKITSKVSSSANIKFHCAIVYQKFIQRELIRISQETIDKAFNDETDPFELKEQTCKAIEDIESVNASNLSTANEVLNDVYKHTMEIADKELACSGIDTGFKEVTGILNGWQNSELIILAARPGMGKTAFALSALENIAKQNKNVAFFSLEMSKRQLGTRLMSMKTGIATGKISRGFLNANDWDVFHNFNKNTGEIKIHIDDTPSLSIFDLRAKSRRLASQHGIKLIIVDYLQLMTAGGNGKGGGNREQEISTISRNLKALAKELGVPVIALSQLSRAVETRGSSKRPLLSDLRESGAIEQDADIVSFIYRPEYYKIDEWDDEEQSPTQGQAEFIIAKHRNGSLENIRLKFIGSLGKFDNLDEYGGSYDDLPSKMNHEDNPFVTKHLPSPNEAFGSNLNAEDDESDVPF